MYTLSIYFDQIAYIFKKYIYILYKDIIIITQWVEDLAISIKRI